MDEYWQTNVRSLYKSDETPVKRLSQNLLSLFTADMVRRLLGFISVAYLARVLGKEDFGAVNLGFAVLAYGMVLSAAGFPTIGTKKIAQGASLEVVGQVIGSRLISTILVLAVIVLTVMAGVQNRTIAWLIILFLFSLLPQIFFVDWFFQGKETMGIVSAARIVQSVVYLAVVLIFVRTADNVLWVAVGSICGECVASAILFTQFRKKFHDIHIRFTPSLRLFKQSAPLAIGIILTTLMMNYPVLALGILKTSSDVGVYSAAGKLVYFLMMGDRILVLLLLPASARKFHDSPRMFQELLRDSVRWILLISLPIAVGGMLIADDLIRIVFGAEYSVSASVLQVFIWYFFLTMLHTVFTSGLIGAGGEKSYGKIMIITALAYFFAVSAGVFWFGPIGAAFGVVAAEGLSVVLIGHALRLLVPLSPPEKILRVVLSVVLMAIGVASVVQYGFLWALLVGVGSYCLFIILLRAVVWNDVKTFMARF
jgi:O-antigen/teichoic acid export membrane protein